MRKNHIFIVEDNNMTTIRAWCRNNIDSEDWDFLQFGFTFYLHLYEPSDVVVFKLKFMSMYETLQ